MLVFAYVCLPDLLVAVVWGFVLILTLRFRGHLAREAAR